MAHPYLLGEKENIAADVFFQKHRCKRKRNDPQKLIVTVTSTGIAYNVRVECSACGKIKDVTNYSDW